VDLALDGLEYGDVVNMQDVTGLERIDFSDILDLGQTEPSIPEPSKGRMVNFLERFGDPADIDKSETWYASSITDTVPKKMNLKTGN
jgi:starvation-inducible outer membrane lipoprotein